MKNFLILKALLFACIAANTATRPQLSEIAGSYANGQGAKLNIFSDPKSEWRGKLITTNHTTRGTYYCGIEGKASLREDALRIETTKCTVVLKVGAAEISVENGIDAKGRKSNCNCGSAGSWFGDFKRSEKKNEIIDFELPG